MRNTAPARQLHNLKHLRGFMDFPPLSPGLEGGPNEPAAPGDDGQPLGHSVNAALAQCDQSFPCRSKSQVWIAGNRGTVPNPQRGETRPIKDEAEGARGEVGLVENEGRVRMLIEELAPSKMFEKFDQSEA